MPSVTRATALTYQSVSEAGSDLIIITTSKLGLVSRLGKRLTQPAVSFAQAPTGAITGRDC